MDIEQEEEAQDGGSINIFYNNIENTGTIQANGGAGGIGTRGNECAPGARGGAGCITKGKIKNGR